MNETTGASVNGATDRNETGTSDPRARRLARVHGLIGLLAAFIFWSPYVFTGLGWVLLTGPVLGAAIVVPSAYNAYRASIGRPSAILSIVVLVLAAAAAASPFLLGVENEIVLGVTAVAGGLAALLSVYTLVDGLRVKRLSSKSRN